jgi:hypothetical protein
MYLFIYDFLVRSIYYYTTSITNKYEYIGKPPLESNMRNNQHIEFVNPSTGQATAWEAEDMLNTIILYK